MTEHHEQPKKSNPFWYINIGHIMSAAIMAVTIFVGYGRLSERFETLAREVQANSLRIAEIDRSGTAASQQKVALDHQIIVNHDARIQRVEMAIEQILVMKEQISRMSEDLHTLREQQKKN